MGKDLQNQTPSARKSPRLKSLFPDRPGFYAESHPENTSNELSATDSSQEKNWEKKFEEQEADLLRYAEQLDRREQELSQKEQQHETQSLKLSESIALFEARKKLMQRKEERLRELEAKFSQTQNSSPASPPQAIEPLAPHQQEEEQKIKEKVLFLTSCEDLLLLKSQQLSEKQAELEQLAEEIGKSQARSRK
ncbi:MAG: hypothetical protein JJT75_01180 [Opitutales bacterium]|nr:hypothetical protein [Opitutales bacterium]